MNKHFFKLFSSEGQATSSSASNKRLGGLEEDERQPLDLTNEENMQDEDFIITQNDQEEDERSDTLRIDDGEDNEKIQLVNEDESVVNNNPMEDDDDREKAFEIYEKNYRSHEIKNSNTALDAKFYEIMEQNCYQSETSHIILSKRYEKICERKVQELEEIYKKTYFLPDEQHFKVKEEYYTLKLEKYTWGLIYTLFEDEKRMVRQYELPEQTDYKDFLWRNSHREIVDRMKTNSEFRKLCLIVEWLEKNARERIDIENEGNWMYTSRKDRQIDPDTVYKQNTLNEDDLRQERLIVKKTWALVRSGQMKDAQMFCRKHDQFWRAATIAGSELYHNPRLLSKEGNVEEENSETVGNQNRFVYLNTLISMLKSEDYMTNDEIHHYEKAIYGSICGDLPSMLAVCNDWEDYLWAYCKATMNYFINRQLAEFVPSDSEDKKYVADVISFTNSNNRSFHEILQSLRVSNNEKVKEEAVHYQHVVQAYIICNQVPELIKYLLDSIIHPAEKSMSYISHFLRFSSHFILTLSMGGDVVFTNDRGKDAILVKYIHYLVNTKQYEHIAFYTRFISEKHETMNNYDYRSIIFAEAIVSIEQLEKEKTISGDNVLRRMLIASAKKNQLNVSEIASIVAEKSLQSAESINAMPHVNLLDSHFFLDPNNNPFNKLREKHTTELDIKKINSIDWLCIEDISPYECLAQSNSLLREFIQLGKLEAFEMLLNKLQEAIDPKLENQYDTPIEKEQQQSLQEYHDWKLYKETMLSYDKWSNQLRQKPQFKTMENVTFKSQADKIKYETELNTFTNTTLKKWAQENDLLLEDAVKKHFKFLERRFLDQEQINDNPPHLIHELKQRCIPDVVFCLYQLLSFSEKYEECMQLADQVASDSLSLFEYFSKEQLLEFLKLMGVCELNAIVQEPLLLQQ
ncbi:hypothetical protein C9374_000592 [Naegleria lovaniensis]|uniref:Nuclear pore complex protein n=1 Tax=Naegleria lovaniensis TaxID=51637 RepID=A0AA88GXZ7_NAELO|nr:uncharacterized protein C9374_000592 [Naegleria lovaniensis]KAG2388428.1 hypothetical protein C9374_000592 [Naegleria lovaniensis]